MEMDINQIAPEEKPESLPVKPKRSTKPRVKTTKAEKPLVEGINTPKVTHDVIFIKPSLTEPEKKLISETDSIKEPKLMPASVIKRSKKSGPVGKLVWLGILVLVLGGGYLAYNWYSNLVSVPLSETLQAQNETTETPNLTTRGEDQTASTTPVTPVAQPEPTVQKLVITATPTGFLNVRETPSTSAKIVARVNPGEIYTFTQQQNGWYKIELTGGKSGWVTAQYIKVQ